MNLQCLVEDREVSDSGSSSTGGLISSVILEKFVSGSGVGKRPDPDLHGNTPTQLLSRLPVKSEDM